jgi:hypothetical protein
MRRNAMLAIAALWLTGCSPTQVYAPVNPTEPASVFLLDHGRHTSLVVSTPDGGLERYAYGDWRFYAEGRTSARHAAAALLWNTAGAVGRSRLGGPATAEGVRRQVPLVIVALHELQVERARVEAFRLRLDAIFSAAPRRRYSPDAGLEFVPHPRDYNFAHNSNRVIANWLTELGCEIRGWPLVARWRIIAPPSSVGPE